VTGHALGAAGTIEAVFCIMALCEQFVPPTINLDNPDPACDLNYVPHVGQAHTMQYAMSNGFGFGGHNAVIILGRYDDHGRN
jgi:3-oxoacyl-[acyl-carrier-protein] synthase II